jgi:uncharacterized protein
MKHLLEEIIQALVDHPDRVSVRAVEAERITVFEVRVAQSDIGTVIGRGGITANAIRTILHAAGNKLHRRFRLEILE